MVTKQVAVLGRQGCQDLHVTTHVLAHELLGDIGLRLAHDRMKLGLGSSSEGQEPCHRRLSTWSPCGFWRPRWCTMHHHGLRDLRGWEHDLGHGRRFVDEVHDVGHVFMELEQVLTMVSQLERLESSMADWTACSPLRSRIDCHACSSTYSRMI